MTVFVYRSTDANAPPLTATAGSFITVLNACLVNGYGQVTLTSLTYSGGIATATYSGGHGFTTGTPVKIAGAAQTEYNGTFAVTVLSTTVFTFAVAGSPVTPATGTITAIRAPAGWTRPYVSGSTGAVYRQGTSSNGFYLNVDNSTIGQRARVRAFETATAFSSLVEPFNGTNPMPSEVLFQGGFYAWFNAGVTRPWIIIATAKGIHGIFDYLGESQSQVTKSTYPTSFYFGDLADTMAGDAYATVICAAASQYYAQYWHQAYFSGSPMISYTGSMAIMRHYHQLGSSQPVLRLADGMLQSFPVFPTLTDGSLMLAPFFVNEHDGTKQVTRTRGTIPGIYQVVHDTGQSLPTEGWQATVSAGPLAGKIFELHYIQSIPVMYEISNTY